jgi:cleavage and polyadenylation specificity factor subunit 4
MMSVLQREMQLFTADTIEYDFENYALSHGIPETLDPLPYRKTGSVFSDDPDGTVHAAEPILTSAKHDPRLRTVVCRHWLRDLCMKGAACEFLHQYDLSKMPLCRHGERCKIKDCPFRHISEGERMECAFYKSGFCIHGPFCRYKHIKRSRDDLPIVADFTLGLSQMQSVKEGEKVMRRPAPKPNEYFKISLCRHFMQGECPFGEGCHFAHGEHELRSFPRKQETLEEPNPSNNLSENMFAVSEHVTIDYFQGGASGGGRPCPVMEPEQANYFLVSAATHRDLALSTVRGEWYVQARHAEQLNATFALGTPVMIFFTVSDSRHIQGAALMKSLCTYFEDSDTYDANNMNDNDEHDAFCYRFDVEWYRTTEFPIAIALEVAPDLLLPTRSTQHCQDMSARTGESLMKAVWNSPLVTLYESWSDEDGLPPPALDAFMTDFRAPAEDEAAWPTMPGPGFIFGCSSDTMDECLGRGLFGLPAHMSASASAIVPGATIFLFNVTDRLLFGIFEALTPAMMNIEASAFSKNPKATVSPFPVQIRVRISLECPPLEDTDPVLVDILRSRGRGRIGPLTHAQTEAVASLLAAQCGALQYMQEYQRGVENGLSVRAPPIALPPRKIVRKDVSDPPPRSTDSNVGDN